MEKSSGLAVLETVPVLNLYDNKCAQDAQEYYFTGDLADTTYTYEKQ